MGVVHVVVCKRLERSCYFVPFWDLGFSTCVTPRWVPGLSCLVVLMPSTFEGGVL